jgi:hypothetical protein
MESTGYYPLNMTSDLYGKAGMSNLPIVTAGDLSLPSTPYLQ